jgi:hypothetical protein
MMLYRYFLVLDTLASMSMMHTNHAEFMQMGQPVITAAEAIAGILPLNSASSCSWLCN